MNYHILSDLFTMTDTEGNQVVALDTMYQCMVKEFGGPKGELTTIREDLGKEKEKT